MIFGVSSSLKCRGKYVRDTCLMATRVFSKWVQIFPLLAHVNINKVQMTKPLEISCSLFTISFVSPYNSTEHF